MAKKAALSKAASSKAAAKPAAKAKAEPKAKAKAAKPVKEAKPKKVAPEETTTAEATAEAPVKAAKPEKVKKTKKSAAADVGAGSEHHNKWLDLKEKHSKEKAVTYAMSGVFEAQQPIQHKTLGWGLILSNNNDRLEVLFETGVKILISNYKQ